MKQKKKYNLINTNIKEIQSKLSDLKESKARNEATIEGIENRKNDILYTVKNELGVENEMSLFSLSDLSNLSDENFPDLEAQKQKVEKVKKQRESLGSVNLRADEKNMKPKLKEWKMIDLIFTLQLLN